ncbi:MAG: translation initiation factor IF-2 [Patescibacteria group bacterium]
MNVTELARRLRTTPEELLEKMPQLGFSVGKRAIKVDNRVAQQIMQAWGDMRRRERTTQRIEEQKKKAEKKLEREISGDLVPVKLPPIITVRDFSSQLDLPVSKVMQELMQNGILAALNERIDYDTAAVIAEDLGFAPELEEGKNEEVVDIKALDRVRQAFENEAVENLEERPPVIVVMGHVDHGKTKLLDAIRTTNVVDSEAGGITQHIGAYQVTRKNKLLTFIDTPGHEAFTVMRSRGAKVADIAILVVAVDDGVQPQTKEAINIIKSAGLPFVVALNKIDREEANIDRVKAELAELGLTPEDWGGKTIMVPVSAKKMQNIDGVLDMLLLLAEMDKDRIRSNPNARAIGTVIESDVNPGEGPVATVLVQSGTLHVGDVLGVKDYQYGKVRAMRDWQGESVKEATPSTPVRIIGWKLSPAVGDIMEVPENIKDLKKIKATDMSTSATEEVASIRHNTQETTEEESTTKTLNIIVRADVLGSLEALLGMLDTIKHDEVSVKVISKGLGNITETDILNAETGDAKILGFNVHSTTSAEELARDKNVQIRHYGVIYKLFDDVISDLQALLPSETVATELGKLEVLATFKKTKDGCIAGGVVKEGKMIPKSKVRIARGGEYIGEGEILGIQFNKSDAKDAKQGQECGFQFKGKTKLEVGDIFEIYSEEKLDRKLYIKGVSKR